jgi:hypothetical protein
MAALRSLGNERGCLVDGTSDQLAGPIVIRSRFTLKPGFTMKDEFRLRNFSAECACVGAVKVLTARAVPAGTSGKAVR